MRLVRVKNKHTPNHPHLLILPGDGELPCCAYPEPQYSPNCVCSSLLYRMVPPRDELTIASSMPLKDTNCSYATGSPKTYPRAQLRPAVPLCGGKRPDMVPGSSLPLAAIFNCLFKTCLFPVQPSLPTCWLCSDNPIIDENSLIIKLIFQIMLPGHSTGVPLWG
jgi:hypothetical protein